MNSISLQKEVEIALEYNGIDFKYHPDIDLFEINILQGELEKVSEKLAMMLAGFKEEDVDIEGGKVGESCLYSTYKLSRGGEKTHICLGCK